MAGDGTYLEWDDKAVQAMLKDAVTRIKDFTPAMKAFSEYLVKETGDRFRKEQAPDGSGWDPLKPATVARKAKMGKRSKILQQDGYLMMVHPQADEPSGGIYSDRKYAAIHNRGGMAGRGRKVKIPQRQFLGINDADVKEFQATVTDWVVLGRKG